MITSYEFLNAWVKSYISSERGASLVEYALLVALIAVVCIAAVTTLGKSASTKFSAVGASISPFGRHSDLATTKPDPALAAAHLAASDPDWATLIDYIGPCGLSSIPKREPYEALVRAVAHQQLHGRAAEAILGSQEAYNNAASHGVP